MTIERGRDRELFVRMVAATALVVLANAAFVSLVLWLTSYVVAVLALFGLHPTGTLGTAIAAAGDASNWRSQAVLPLTAAFLLGQYLYATRRPVGAGGVDVVDAPADLQGRLRRLAKQAGLPAPDLVVAEAPEPNSYTVGRHGSATVVVTRRLLSILDDDELDAVLAHELAHVANRDVTVMTVATTPFRLAGRLALVLDRFAALTGRAFLVLWAVAVTAMTVAAVVAELTPFSARFLWGPLRVVYGAYMTVGGPLLFVTLFAFVPLVATGAYRVLLDPVPRLLARYREFAADRGAARVTGDPAALASALEILEGDPRPEDDVRRRDPVAALCLRPGGVGAEPPRGPIRAFVGREFPAVDAAIERLSGPLVAHPPTDVRIDHLRALTG